MEKANYTKVRFKSKKVNFIAPLLTKMHTDSQFSIGFKDCCVSRYLKDTSRQSLDSGNLRSDKYIAKCA